MVEAREWWAGPLCIAADMNAVRSEVERNHGAGDGRNNALLNNYILEYELIDQPLIGGSFTWSNNHSNPLLCGLDRFLFSHDFEEAFPNALQIVLTRTISNHNPILVISEPSLPSKPYFKLDRLWTEHKDFVKNVQQWWEAMAFHGSASTTFFLKLQNLKHLIKPWRIQEFGSVARDKNVLTCRIHDLNILEEAGALQQSQLEERIRCKLQLRSIEAMEARKWQLRAKKNNFRWEDSNTKYFHSIIASARRKRNTIAKLQVGGVDSFDHNIIKEKIRNFYINLFTQQNELNSGMENLYFPTNKESDKLWMEREFSEEFNCSFITLIPKKEDSYTPKDFRPLNLIDSVYKIISKLLAARLKKVEGEEAGWCVTTSHLSVLVNDSSTEKLKPSKGLRQGDSLSPYFFLLVVEVISKLINDAVVRGKLSGFQVVDQGTIISHLQFAEDTLFFIDAAVEEVRRLLIILVIFETITGLKLNLEKSTMINVGADDVIDVLTRELGCKSEKLPLTYLSMPIRAHWHSTSVWDYVLVRMEQKLATWKKRKLNKAGRFVLIKSCLASLPIYYLSLFHLPVSMEKRMSKSCATSYGER
ncbi:uncharacterized protein LOC113294470 [Papaver somniferum]|uniref:uncharacterized protein LOC113294470 n=1 Tax=Papaver somniferum TaxID=3469 RepID=UPI000E700D29|nr:uncharacterized protein LOC113294470 [Papaver somniferum]